MENLKKSHNWVCLCLFIELLYNAVWTIKLHSIAYNLEGWLWIMKRKELGRSGYGSLYSKAPELTLDQWNTRNLRLAIDQPGV
jgi:hypothetical protein